MNRFDSENHQYYITTNGVERAVPSVTQVLREVLPGAIWQAGEFYLGRGQAVHACAALVAKGRPFRCDPQIAGHVVACRKWFDDFKPQVIAVEIPIYSARYMFAGTPDLVCKIGGKLTILDWKSALSPVAEIQIGAYSIEHPSARWGMVVALQEDGNYKCGTMFKVDRARNEFMSCLSVYNIRKRLKIKEVKDED